MKFLYFKKYLIFNTYAQSLKDFAHDYDKCKPHRNGNIPEYFIVKPMSKYYFSTPRQMFGKNSSSRCSTARA